MPNPNKFSFDAVANRNTRVVVLGSLPGDMSLERKQYYARPTNQFWRLIGAVIEQDINALSYDRKLAVILNAGVGLWDVIKTAHRDGSSDSAIRNHQPNSMNEFAASLPSLKALAFNGGKPSAIGRKQIPASCPYAVITLPSSSAAYCSISFAQKLEVWKNLRQYL